MKRFIFLAVIALASMAFSPPGDPPLKHEKKKIELKAADAPAVIDVAVYKEEPSAFKQEQAEFFYHFKNKKKEKTSDVQHAVVRQEVPPDLYIKGFKDHPQLE